MGLDIELFADDIQEEYLCGLCHKVLLNPVTAGCSHIFCSTCVDRRLKSRVSKPICPYCSSNLKKDVGQTTIEFKIKLLSLSVQCTHKCGDLFTLGELPDHTEICPNAPVTCAHRNKGCKKTVRRRDLQKHLEECDFRTVECEACGHMTMYCDLFTHQSRVRCLERKLKQQVIRERRSTSQELQRHRNKLFRDHARLEQHQRKRILDHSKELVNMKTMSAMGRRDTSIKDMSMDEDFGDGVFLTQSPVENGRINNDELPKVDIMARTPHSSRSGFVLQSCIQCKRLFRADANHQRSCRWHAGYYQSIKEFGS